LRAFENGVLRRVFGPKGEDGEGCIITRVIKSRRMKLEGHVARMGKRKAVPLL